jgi:hypothetical protein
VELSNRLKNITVIVEYVSGNHSFVLSVLESLQTTLAAEARMSEGQCLIEEPILSEEKSVRYEVGT